MRALELPRETSTPAARTILTRARQQAILRRSEWVEPEHILLGILEVQGNTALKMLAALNKDPDEISQWLEARLPPPRSEARESPQNQGQGCDPNQSERPYSEAGQRTIQDAIKEAHHLGHAQVDAVHLIMGMFYETHGPAHAALAGAGLSLYDLRTQVLQSGAFKKRTRPASGAIPRPSWRFLALAGTMVLSGLALYLELHAALVPVLAMLFVVSGWIVSVCIHEFGHALAAYAGGDHSVREAGYLTLDPLRYTHPLLSIVMPIVFLLLGGIGLPGGAVYVHLQTLRSDGWRSFVSAAGPLGTVLFALVIIVPFSLGSSPKIFLPGHTPNSAFWSALAFLGFLQITALLLNLLPIPPLDGFGILEPFLPQGIADTLRQYSSILFLLLIVMLWMGGPLTDAFWMEAFTLARKVGLPIDFIVAGMDQFFFWR
ncbi:MAG: hypothetical protein HC884_07120 [Chloroflexaceae bacterium]|nr:hypothetical protein [Chloroflexaceae bacterium]